MRSLTDSSLFRTQCYIDGAWCDADSKELITVDNPATGEAIGTVPKCGGAETTRAIDAAQKAWAGWRELLPKERAERIMAWHALIEEHKHDLARIMTLEQGKPLSEAMGEIVQNNAHLSWCAGQSLRLYGEVLPQPRKGVLPLTFHEPVGIVFAITPWNFPMGMIARKAAPALAVGCPVVIKPASATPYSALALAELADRAGFPAGILNVVTGSALAIVEAMGNDSRVRKVTFTGSTEVGKSLLAVCAKTVKRTSMELGGNAPALVFDDADLDLAVDSCFASKFRCTGQACIGVNRIFVHQNIAEAFIEKFVAKTRALKVGNGLEDGVAIGPMINRDAVAFLEGLITDAVGKGADILHGGHRHCLGGNFFEPTVLGGVTPAMRIFHEEIFGPIAPILTFEDESDVVAQANDTPYGLASYLYTRDIARIHRLARALESGMVGVNECGISMAEVPFGGVKESGLGREGGSGILKEYVDTRYALIGGL